MINRSLRRLLLGSAVTVGLVASAGMAQAVEYNFGAVKLNVDTTISAGASMNVANTDHALLPTSNGGPIQGTFGLAGNCGAGTFFVAPGATSTADCHTPAAINGGVGSGADQVTQLNSIQYPTVISGSINTDDGRLNFSRGDLTSGVVKMTNDLSASWENYHFFGRLSSYYDAVLSNNGSYNRYGLRDGKADAARDVKILDFYASADYDVGNLPLNVRAGKQVISWGESTFIQNGINTFNPVDVGAVRRPGAELKEFFIPVWALDASIGLPYNLSLEAFYQLKWDTFATDRAGTPFAGSDVAAVGGNNNNYSYLTGGPGGNIMQNCSNPNSVNAAFNLANAANPYKSCAGLGATTYDYANYNTTLGTLGGWPIGSTEAIRNAAGDTSVVQRDEDRYAKNSGQWGVAARWYSEELNNTEFGLYFSNTHSRLPIASERVTTNPTGSTFQSYLSTGPTSSQTTRLLPYAGCNAPAGAAAAVSQPVDLYGVPLGLTPGQVAQMNQTLAPGNTAAGTVLTRAEAIATAFYSGAGAPADYGVITQPGASPFAAGVAGTNLTAAATALGGLAGPAAALMGVTVNANSVLEANIVNCALIAMQATQLAPGTPVMLTDGAQILFASDAAAPALGLYLEYPEDIHMMGASFNTTIGTWGVQGEMSYRSNAPVQLDTDQLAIAALNSACTFQQLLGASAYNALIPGSTGLANPDTYGTSCGGMMGATTRDITGYVRTKMITAQVGTTATYTNSNVLINSLGADLGILVTEVGMTYFPDAPSTGSAKDGSLRWGNVCTGGTDLPLGGFLALASREGCRPTNSAWGYVLLGQLQYNNAFGTALTLSPTLAFSHDVSGNTPAPYSNYRQGRKSINLAINGSFQNAWKGGISYTNFFGNDKYNSAVDRDNIAVNISYAF